MRWLLVIALVACHHEDPPPTIKQVAPQHGPHTGSGGASYVRRTAASGVLSLVGDHDVAMTMAYRLMEQHCGKGKFSVVEDGEDTVHYQCR
ncbi:MAG: hypothetical protein QM831_35840 [Kofleriaceae bacterium]